MSQFSGARPESAFEAMLKGHIAKSGAKDQGMQDALLVALQTLKAGTPPQAFDKAYRYLKLLSSAPAPVSVLLMYIPGPSVHAVVKSSSQAPMMCTHRRC